ncbi:MAG: hypothetical protein JWM33_2182 [Caulobacteraceae bacterium]|nr:hypothetical protein [Caulobacteraceae bacterium]
MRSAALFCGWPLSVAVLGLAVANTASAEDQPLKSSTIPFSENFTFPLV